MKSVHITLRAIFRLIGLMLVYSGEYRLARDIFNDKRGRRIEILNAPQSGSFYEKEIRKRSLEVT